MLVSVTDARTSKWRHVSHLVLCVPSSETIVLCCLACCCCAGGNWRLKPRIVCWCEGALIILRDGEGGGGGYQRGNERRTGRHLAAKVATNHGV